MIADLLTRKDSDGRLSSRAGRPAMGVEVPAMLSQEARDHASEREILGRQRARVLCVDDVPANLLALEATLADLDVEVAMANSGADALRCLLKEDFALILLDVKMPGMDGFETAELIRQRKRCEHTPIIFMTAFEREEQQMFKGYSLRAVDYLCKPIIPQVLCSKVAVFVDLHRQARQIKEQAIRLVRMEHEQHERQLQETKERYERERVREELRLARQIQQKLFPTQSVPVGGFDIGGASYPAEATGGDYFDYIPMPDGGLGVVIGDVSGHGLGPALLMAELRAYLRAFLLTRTDVGEIVSLLNRALAEDAPEWHFATLFLARLDPATRSLVYSSAGHLPGYILRPSGEVKLTLKATGMPLAVVTDGHYDTAATPPLAPGEMLVLLTDGLIEAHGPDERLFGIERVFEVIRSNQQRTAKEIVATLYQAVRTFCGTPDQLDDMTAIIVKATAGGLSAAACC
jgi:phosphoserine phosphatase RsbU/P